MLPADNALFVDRDDDIRFFKKLIQHVKDSEPAVKAANRVIHIIGTSKIGKTTLLKRYEYCLHHEIPDCWPLFISIRDYLNLPVHQFKRRILASVELQIADRLGTMPIEEAAIDNINVFKNMERLHTNQVVVFLIDEVSALARNPTLVHALEDVLQKCLLLSRLVIVLAGRNFISGWQSFELRPTPGKNVRTLEPFSYTDTESQINSFNPAAGDLVKRIFDISGGSPGNNRIILEQARGDPLEIVEADAIRICNSELYEALADLEQELRPDRAKELLPALEALCVLQDFDREYEAPVMFDAHRNLDGTWDAIRTNDLFSVLEDIQVGPGRLIDWDNRKKAFAIEEHFRANLEHELELRDKNLWQVLHCAAMDMYDVWAKDYVSEIYASKEEYHRGKLQTAGVDHKSCKRRAEA